MKEATSELANVLVVVSSVAILIAFFYFTIWPLIRNNFDAQTACQKAICETKDTNADGMVKCRYEDNVFECPFKG